MQRCSIPYGKRKCEHTRSLSETSSSLSLKKLKKLQQLDEKRQQQQQEQERENALKMVFVREEERMNKNMKSISMKDIMRSNGGNKELKEKLRNSSFYDVHVLLRYQEDMLTSSYVRPTSRSGSTQLSDCGDTSWKESCSSQR